MTARTNETTNRSGRKTKMAKATKSEVAMKPWAIEGELILNCNCTVFCPCVVSLGKHPPTEGYCQAWSGVRIDRGTFGDIDLSGLNVAMLLDIPGKMERGNWTLGLWLDDRADDDQFAALETIFRGQARGSTGLFSLLVGSYLGPERAPVEFTTDGDVRSLSVGKIFFFAIALYTNLL